MNIERMVDELRSGNHLYIFERTEIADKLVALSKAFVQVFDRERKTLDEITRLRELVQCLLDNDPNEPAADGGVTVLQVWRQDALRALGAEPANAEKAAAGKPKWCGRNWCACKNAPLHERQRCLYYNALLDNAEKAAARVATWSPEKQEYANRIINTKRSTNCE